MPAIGDYAIIGDGRSAALVARNGTIDWLCWPRFESSPIFGAILDDERGGTWRIAACEPAQTTRCYREHTNVLETTFTTTSGRAVVTDLMTIASEEDKRELLMPEHELLRYVRCDEGEIAFDVDVCPRPDFKAVRAKDLGALGLRWEMGSSLLTLRAEAPLRLDDAGDAHARVHLHAGEHVVFSLAYEAEAPAVLPLLGLASLEAIDRSARWWRDWAECATYHGPYRELVLRSALALKLLSFAPSGAIVAAPTTSLPERTGGPLNWDYRYCWLRDASFTVRALLDLGYIADGEAFCSWLLHATRLTRPELRVLYDVYGKSPPRERELDVAGYRGSKPVRIGNLAFDQLQLDTYGEVIDATAQIARITGHLDRETQHLLRDYGRYVCEHWREPDAGIWEPREQPRHRTHSRVCCWVAIDRLIKLCRAGLLERVDVDRLESERAAIRKDIEEHAYDEAHHSYASWLGGSDVDAALLQMSWFGFHPASSPRMTSTFERIREQLSVGPGLFQRNVRATEHAEGAFWICSFWAVEHLARAGKRDEGRRLFEEACAYANDLGLMAEEVDPRTGAQLGNFPQAYTHVGAISAALALEEHR
jgi:GH15 family glucan-1,4-alpha-glucosidase